MKKFLCMVKKGGEQSLFSEVIEAEYAEAALQLFFRSQSGETSC